MTEHDENADAGQALADGVAEGIESKVDDVADAAAAVVEEATTEAAPTSAPAEDPDLGDVSEGTDTAPESEPPTVEPASVEPVVPEDQGDGWNIPDTVGPVPDADAGPVPDVEPGVFGSEEREALVLLALDSGITNARDLTDDQLRTALGGATEDLEATGDGEGEALPEFDAEYPEGESPGAGAGDTATLESPVPSSRRARSAPRLAGVEFARHDGFPEELRERLKTVGISRPLFARLDSEFAAMDPTAQAQFIDELGSMSDAEVERALAARTEEVLAENAAVSPHDQPGGRNRRTSTRRV